MPDGIVAVKINAGIRAARRREQPHRVLLRRVPAARPRRQPRARARPARTSATSSSRDLRPMSASRNPGRARRPPHPARPPPHRAGRRPAHRRARAHRLVARQAQGGAPADAARQRAAAVERGDRGRARRPPRAVRRRRPRRGLRRQRTEALAWMQRLAQWEPLLVGGVAAGWATEHSDVRLELVADDPKAVEIALASAGVAYAALPPRDDDDAATHLRIDRRAPRSGWRSSRRSSGATAAPRRRAPARPPRASPRCSPRARAERPRQRSRAEPARPRRARSR